jgi:shikimate dehydrogenase
MNGETQLIAHIGYPTATFKSPMIYNPWFERRAINAAVVPLGVTAEDFDSGFRAISRFTNFLGGLITMPHKVAVIPFLDEASTAVKVAGSCNAVRREADGRLVGDMFDGEGFVRGVKRNGGSLAGRRVLIVGAGGVGSAISASCAQAGAAVIALYDIAAEPMMLLAARLRENYPNLEVSFGSNDPAGFDVVVNATPLGMRPGDPMPVDVARLSPSTYVGEVVMRAETTAFLSAARARGCAVQVGVDMLFEQIPAYLEFFGFPRATVAELREVGAIAY